MNITPQVPNLSIPTVLNPHTESLRRENNQREIITKPAAASQSAAEKGVASDKERGRTPAQNNASIDFASISEQAELANTSIAEKNEQQNQDQQGAKNSDQEVEEQSNTADAEEPTSTEEPSRAEQLQQARVISELQQRDKEVRAHESAHASVGGSVTGAPSLSYTTGPDGKRYAVEGEVSVDLSTVKGDARATITKMQKVHAAALAPVHPSIQDTRVASTATQIIMAAQSELLAELSSERSENQARSSRQGNEEGSTKKATLTENDSSSFDILIKKTLENQEKVVPTQSADVIQRALRIESYYSGITQAYEKPATSQFELTA